MNFFFCNMSHVWLSCTKDFCIQILLSMRYTSFSDNFKLAVEVRDRSTGWQNLLWSVYPRKTSPSVLPTGSDTKLPCWPLFLLRSLGASMLTARPKCILGEGTLSKTVTFLWDWYLRKSDTLLKNFYLSSVIHIHTFFLYTLFHYGYHRKRGIFLFVLFLSCHMAYWDLRPYHGWNPHPHQWKGRILTTRPPGNSQNGSLMVCTFIFYTYLLQKKKWLKKDGITKLIWKMYINLKKCFTS